MQPREVVGQFWQAMRDNDFGRAGALLADECVVSWPCSGEQFVGPDAFAVVQQTYPCASGRWDFDLHRVVADGDTVVTEVTVADGEPAARVVSIFTVRDGRIVAMTEYWPAYYDAPHDRPGVVTAGPRVP